MVIKAVVLDWAGTMVDHGSLAPVSTLIELFADSGVAITAEEVRLSMGISKKDHLRELIRIPRIKDEWGRTQGVAPTEDDIEQLYADFQSKQIACLKQYSKVISGVPEILDKLRQADVKIGSTTGYSREMLNELLSIAEFDGWGPDVAFCPSDVPGGRPAPWMCYRNAIELKVYPFWHMVKIGDTPSDVLEGLSAGMWTIAITRTGNEVGMEADQWHACPKDEQSRLLICAAKRLQEAGAHYICESVADAMPILEEISARITVGDRP